ncbi:hypothetical protein M885DRAFT_517009 [Pelagophyceae sp. CCMP2097]|nr:hypothetical protein M885DRAFT_517009 [Pelagophyceae sp. CCMP2097]|mmetsp:Transcript_7388/g.25884  ORF Transcript_7388/g.25884 Transcript_7388/m.25884 type:complete len:170 (-) Transcript_7388:43-552(-)
MAPEERRRPLFKGRHESSSASSSEKSSFDAGGGAPTAGPRSSACEASSSPRRGPAVLGADDSGPEKAATVTGSGPQLRSLWSSTPITRPSPRPPPPRTSVAAASSVAIEQSRLERGRGGVASQLERRGLGAAFETRPPIADGRRGRPSRMRAGGEGFPDEHRGTPTLLA